MAFLLRLFPSLAALIIGLTFYWQLEQPQAYPWIALIGVAAVVAAIIAIGRRRNKLADLVEKMLPTVLLLISLVFGMLLAEGFWARLAIVFFATVATFLSLELLFLLSFMPSRYPMSGLSHVNIGYVPLIIWYTVANSVGLITFLHSPDWIHVVVMTLLSAVLFRTTGHPGATNEQNRLWTLVGGLTGFHLGLLGVILPMSMAGQATLGMIIFCAILRLRRYLYHPLPSRRQAWLESVAAVAFLVIVMGTARWL
ncbi:MAG: hypothetical protein PHC70_04560 [Patescibacteria group bacterium]|nr:hypothetical protein [Patescibacteria group bacterium]